MKPTTMVRLWSLKNVFLLWLIRPAILELTDERCVVSVATPYVRIVEASTPVSVKATAWMCDEPYVIG